jgi:hypothetical protein
MATGSYTLIIAVAFGLLVFVFAVALMLVFMPSVISHTDFTFSISRRAVSIFVFALVALFATVVVLCARALRRRRGN